MTFGRRVGLIVVLSLCVVTAVSCSGITTIYDTQKALQNAGFGSVKVSPKPTTNQLEVSVHVDAVPSEIDVERVAAVVWHNFRERFDELDITVHGSGPELQQSLTFAQMQEALGQRNPAWNKSTVTSGIKDLGFDVIAGVAALGVIVAVTVVLVKRRNRRRPPPPPASWLGRAGGWGPGPVGAPPTPAPTQPPYPSRPQE